MYHIDKCSTEGQRQHGLTAIVLKVTMLREGGCAADLHWECGKILEYSATLKDTSNMLHLRITLLWE